MDIWILVGILLLVAIVLLVMSMFSGDKSDSLEEIEHIMASQSEQLLNLNTRLTDIEQQVRQRNLNGAVTEEVVPSIEEVVVPEEPAEKVEPLTQAEIDSISNEDRERIIYLYTHGYLMHEIAEDIGLDARYIENVVDDYIVNR